MQEKIVASLTKAEEIYDMAWYKNAFMMKEWWLWFIALSKLVCYTTKLEYNLSCIKRFDNKWGFLGGGGFQIMSDQFNPITFIEVPVSNQVTGQWCICVLGVLILPLFLPFFSIILWNCSNSVIFLRGGLNLKSGQIRGVASGGSGRIKGGGLLYIKIFSRPKVYNLTFLPPFLIMQSYTSNEFIWSCQRCTRYHADAEKVVSNNKTWYI